MAFDLGTGYIVLSLSKAGFDRGISAVSRSLSVVNSAMDRVVRTTKRLTLAGNIYGTLAVRSYGLFDRAMREATAVSEVSEAQFEKMTRMAEKQSIRLNMAATETAKAFYYLGSAGLSVTEQMQAYVPTATLAKAATITMGEAAEMLVDTMKGFLIPFEKTTHVTDVMAKAVTSSNMTFAQMGQALSYVSGVARTANNTLEETSAMLATMADVGIKGTRAGVMLRRALLNMMAPMSAMRKLMEQYNIQTYDAQGKMKPFIQLIGEMADRLQGASEEQRNMVFKTLFGARAVAGQIALFDKGADALKAYTKALEQTGGAAEKVATKQMAAPLNQLMITWQRIMRMTRTFGELLTPAVLRLAENVGNTADRITAYLRKNKHDFMEWGEKVAVRIIAVKEILKGLARYILTNWKGAFRWGLLGVTELFKAFIKSVSMLLKEGAKHWFNIIMNINKTIALLFIKGWGKLLKAISNLVFEALKITMFPAETLKTITVEGLEIWYSKTKKNLETAFKAGRWLLGGMEFKTKPLEELGGNIADNFKAAAEKFAEEAPKEIKDVFERVGDYIVNADRDIKEKYERMKAKAVIEKMAEATRAGRAGGVGGMPTPATVAGKVGFVSLVEAYRIMSSNIQRQQLTEQQRANRLLESIDSGLDELPDEIADSMSGLGLLRVSA